MDKKKPLNQKLCWGPAACVFTGPPGDSDANKV